MWFRGNYEFLSNFAPSWIYYKERLYPTVEHAFQAQKCINKHEQLDFAMNGKYNTAGKAKRAGRHVTMRGDWEEVKNDIMLDLLRIKFSQPSFRDSLLATGDAYISEENNWHDTYWGVCNGEGKNMLGKLLMQVRDELRQSQS